MENNIHRLPNMRNEDLARELYRSRVKDRIAHCVTVACLVALIVTFGAIMFYLGRLSIEIPVAPREVFSSSEDLSS